MDFFYLMYWLVTIIQSYALLTCLHNNVAILEIKIIATHDAYLFPHIPWRLHV